MQTITKTELKEKLLKSKELKKSWNISKKYSPELTLEKHAEEYAESFFKTIIPAIKNRKTIYAYVDKVSSSGMTRTANFYVVDKDGEIICVNHFIRLALDYTNGKDGYTIKLHGCGMDMLFNTVYNVSYMLFKDGYQVKKANL